MINDFVGFSASCADIVNMVFLSQRTQVKNKGVIE